MCKHCGSTEDFWWSRSEPMGYYCSDCGAADESTTYPYVEVQGNIIAELSSRNDWLNKELAAVTEQRDRLQRWKDEQLAIEIKWDAQAVGRLLGMTVGNEIREGIEPAIRSLIEQRDRLIKAIEPLKYWRDISECDCSNPLPQGGCLRCDLERILKTTNPNEL